MEDRLAIQGEAPVPLGVSLATDFADANVGFDLIRSALDLQGAIPFSITLNDLGACYRALGEVRKSIEYHERALAIDPTRSQARKTLAFTAS